MERTMKCCEMFFNWCCPADDEPQSHSTGSMAFEEYRTDTLRRLEEEQREFGAFLARLHAAKDKEEFEQFLAARRRKGSSAAL
jgi:Protein of unknown function (DUF2852)